MENVQTILGQVRDAMTVKRVFGDPIERDGVTVIPVAKVGGGGGGGGSTPREHAAVEGPGGSQEPMGGGGVGFGVSAKPAGVYIIKNGEVSWEPAVDVNHAILGGQIVGIFALVLIYLFLRARQRGQ